MALVRLDKYLADLGLASRRELKEMIRRGRVSVDGVTALRPEQKLNPAVNRVTLDGTALEAPRSHVLMMDKPAGVVTATEDRQQKTVLDLLPDKW